MTPPTRDQLTRRRVLAGLGAATLAGITSQPRAQTRWPDKSIRIVVPFAAGISPDIVARLVSDPVAKALGQPIVIDNRAGASGMIGAEAVARSAADGYTIFLTVESIVGVLPHIYSKQSYNHFKDFTSVIKLVDVPYYLVTGAGNPIKTLGDLIAEAKKRPSVLDYGSLGIGSGGHVRMEMMNNMAGVRMTHIPYKGSPMPDLISGQLTSAFEPATTAIPLIKGGKLRALAVTSSAREPALPDVPTVAETVPGYSADGWQALVVPTGTPKDVVVRLNAEFAKALRRPDVRNTLRDLGLHPVGNSIEDFDEGMKAEYQKWGKVAKDNNIKVD